MLEAIYKKGGVFKYPKTFQCGNGSEFKNEVKKLFEKHNAEIRRATTKYNQTHTAFVEAFNPIQDGWGVKKAPPTSFSHVTSTNVTISPQNFLTFSFNPFDRLV